MTKFIRRLQKIGSSILVSLPKEWVDANKLEKSDEVELETGINSLSITLSGDHKLPKEVVISYPRRYAPVIFAMMFSSFETGYNITTSFGSL